MSDIVQEMKRAAALVEQEGFMGFCAGGMPLIGGKLCEFCGADYSENCKRLSATTDASPKGDGNG